ncbi:hypothetical protein DFQ30_008792 [Apophysomyces sp. BC1015]|nr:hypothetical protein DFQ30_008792 [Apophysomyces sp. BC1015]
MSPPQAITQQPVTTTTGSIQTTTLSQQPSSPTSSGTVTGATGISQQPSVNSNNTVTNATPTSGTLPQNVTNPVAGLPTTGSFNISLYPGSITFLTPTPSGSVSPLYPIESKGNVTFVWEFKSLSVRPINLTLAAQGPQSANYPIATLQGDATSAVWHLSDVPPNAPLMEGFYQIQLYDQRGVSATIQPGWLSPATTMSIALYAMESYTPMTSSPYCALCLNSAGMSFKDPLRSLGIAFGVACVTSILFIHGLLYE